MVQRSRQKPARPAWSWREIPVLNETACTGCGLCCVLCPTDCLAMSGTVPWLHRPAACIGCAVCVLVCPAAALEMNVLKAEEECGGE
jgi:MinD superfamily P-loop ATPase